jgi:hypothetical protein
VPEYSRPASYLGKLQFAQRVVKAAQYRPDTKQAVRELCEAVLELANALIDREEGRDAPPAPGQPGQPPTP